MKNLIRAFLVFSLLTVNIFARGEASIYAWKTLTGHPGGPGNSDGPGSLARFWYPADVAVDTFGNVYVADAYNSTIRKITTSGQVTTLAGLAGQPGIADGTNGTARFSTPSSVAVDSAGNVYVVDSDNSTIRKVTSSGVVTTLAGLAGEPGSADGSGSTARFSHPVGVAVDASGNVYVSDTGNSTIRKVTPSGVVTTLGGTAGESGSADGPTNIAQFFFPSGLAVDSSGNVYVADTDNQVIRKITPGGQVSTLAGTVGESGTADGTNDQAQFSFPSDVTVDTAGNVYVTDGDNSTIRKISAAGEVITLAGLAGEAGAEDGAGTAARFSYPGGLSADAAGNLFVADTYNSTIRKVTSDGTVTTLAGSIPQNGSADASGNVARFRNPYGVAVDSSGNLYVADTFNDTIRKVTFGGLVSTIAGSANQPGSADGMTNGARFNAPYGLAADAAGNLFIADTYNNTIRQMSSTGLVTTLAGSPGQAGSSNGTGATARFSSPTSVAQDHLGNLYVADFYSNIVRKVTSGGIVTTLAGSPGQSGSSDGTNGTARFNGPFGVAVDSAGNVYVSDLNNDTIRKITTDGIVTTLAGTAGQSGNADGTNGAAQFFSPAGIAIDSADNLYVADVASHTIRKVTSSGVVTTVAGAAGQPGNVDGTGSGARFFYPVGVAADASGNLYVADFNNSIIRKITSGGVVTTLAGLAGEPGSVDVTADRARFSDPSGVAVDNDGSVFVADTQNHAIRKVTRDGAVRTIAGVLGESGSMDGTGNARLYHPVGLALDTGGNLYVADSFNHTVRKVTAGGAVTTLAGTAGLPGSADGTGAAARFSYPSGVAVDSGGNIFISDSYNSTLRRVTSAGVVTTLAGSPGQPGSTDGSGSAARFDSPNGLAVDSTGILYVADSANSTIRKVTGGVVTTWVGSPGEPGSADGTNTAARFNYPVGLAVDIAGNIYVADSANSNIRKVTSAGVVTTIGGIAGVFGGADGIGESATFFGPAGIAVDSVGRLFVGDAGNNRISRGLRLPSLNIANSAGGLVLSWPSSSTGFALQQSGNLASPNAWSKASYALSDDGTNKTVTLAFPPGNQFFRLIAD